MVRSVAPTTAIWSTEKIKELEHSGSIFNSNSDSEVILHLIARSQKPTIEEAVIEALLRVDGAFSCVFLTADRLIAVRDPHGFRPLVMGSLGDAKLFASETCAFDLLDAKFLGEVEPGEMVVINDIGMIRRFRLQFEEAPHHHCIFEHIYFARPDGMFGESTHHLRETLGQVLARESGVEADLVVPVPDSGVCAALGFSKESGIPISFGLIRKSLRRAHLIEPKQSIRHFYGRSNSTPFVL